MKAFTKICAFIALTCMALSAHAGLIFTIEGTTGSNDYSITASGSYLNNGQAAMGNNSNCCFRAIRTDIGSTGWYAPSSQSYWSGSMFSGDHGTLSNFSGSLLFDITGDVEAQRTASQVWALGGVWQPSAFDQLWPIIEPGENITMTASGTINFTSSLLFEDLIQGTYSLTGNFTDSVDIIVREAGTSVPVSEPSSIALLGLGLFGLGFARRKQQA